MWEALRNIVQPVPTPTDPQDARLRQRQEVPPLRQMLRLHAGPLHAHPHAQPQSQVQRVRQGLLAALAAPGAHEVALGRQALRVRALRQVLCRPLQPAGAHADPLGFQEFQL